ncbi:MAG: hypothetical protein JWQ90_5546 [Hydrocarboniphaga sp.]|uniref:putative bifunctional diguanylate cyclase/phosphodiesterase n=1 Tax=Hydrocarboniphaga sp. TaxID=2033016 RepID=UPI0026220E19|nr:GGDEF domain-containing phosphodiesterase [Hydrocarboniphaga sp.]MDB5973096.1 hypothetical protein [Hydrocarboniphaga sp.]
MGRLENGLDGSVTLTGSLGLTFIPDDGADAETLLRHADQAMYQAKQGGRGNYCVFDAGIERKLQTCRQVLQDFERALAAGELKLYYEPKIHLRTGEVIGAEVLLRWQHPQRGLLQPDEFLSKIENSELICELGEWLIVSACEQLQAWELQGLDFSLSINIAAHHLRRPDFSARVAVLLDSFPGLRREHLEFEIVETGALSDLDGVALTMQRCCDSGVRFALDDFGTGYSSLTYLRRLPVATIKIDRSFVLDILHNASDRELVRSIIGLARSLGRSVIAEGIETPAHRRALLDLGCELGQGYGIAKPMPSETFSAWAEDWLTTLAR